MYFKTVSCRKREQPNNFILIEYISIGNVIKIVIIQNSKLLDTWENIEMFKAYKTCNILNEQIPNINNPLFNTILKINS